MLKARHGFSFIVAAVSVLLLVACGDDNSTKASDKIVVDSVEDLSNCVATKVGNLEYVDTVAYVCIELGDKIKWVQVAGVEDNSEDFRACTGKKDGLYSFSPKENTLYVCNDEEWVPVKQLDDNDSMEESSSSSAKSSSSSSAKSSSSEKSSSSTKSSSSGAKSSSSSVTPKSSDSETSVSSSSEAKSSSSSDGSVYDSINNTLKDLRDGQTYKTVTIGSQTWMAENLNNNPSGSYFDHDEFDPPPKYGRVYAWATAKKVCPSGWHLPTRVEFDTLFTAVGGQSTAGKALKSTSGWNDGGNGADAFGFSALPAGYNYYDGQYDAEGDAAYFWTSTEVSDEAYFVNLNYDNDSAYLIQTDGKHYHESDKYSVRCLKDAQAE